MRVASPRRRGSLLLALVAAALCAGAMTWPAAAQASPTVDLEPTTGPAGTTTTVTGTGWPSGLVELFVDAVDPDGVLVQVTSPRSGSWSTQLTVPDVPEGRHSVLACHGRNGRTCGTVVRAIFTVTPAPTTTRSTTTTSTATTSPPIGTPTTATTAPSTTGPGDVTAGSSTTAAPGDEATPTTRPGPDPTFDPDPDGLTVGTTTTTLGLATGDPPGEFPDLSVRAIEVTQGIQSLSNAMPLVANRKTWARVHVEVDDGDPWAPVDGLMLARRSGRPDLVIVPENGPIGTGHPRTDVDSALNFLLPAGYDDPGTLQIDVVVWSFDASSLADQEPDPANNTENVQVVFQEGEDPSVVIVALDDGGGPGPDITSLDVLLEFAVVIYNDLRTFHPVTNVSFDAFPDVLLPGPEATKPGVWDLTDDDDDPAYRSEPNVRLAFVAEIEDLFDVGAVMGRFDASIPADGYSGWATDGVSWNKPTAGTPSHELGHTRGLAHVGCKDDDDDGVPDELIGGGLDPLHPSGLPPVCSLAPISVDGYYGFTTYATPVRIFSNDPTHPTAAYPFMGYKSPKWTDPYNWCILLEAYGIPCSPASIGVPPRQLVYVDCEPEGEGLQLDLCLIDQLPPPGDPELPPLPQPTGGGNQDDDGADGTQVGLVGPDGRLLHLQPSEPDGFVLVSGDVDATVGAGSLGLTWHKRALTDVTSRRAGALLQRIATGAPGLAQLRVIDASGALLVVMPVDIVASGHGDDQPAVGPQSFLQAVPWSAGAAEIELLVDGVVVDRVPVSGNPPTVTDVVVAPSDAGWAVTWAATDVDGDALVTEVSWSADGERWYPVGRVGDGSTSVPRGAAYPGGDAVRIRVSVGDGVWSASALSAPFDAPTRPAVVGITGAADGTRFDRTFPVDLAVIVLDPEHGVDADSTIWTSDRDGDLGAGGTLTVRTLSVGRHQITATVVDEGVEVSDEIVIEVVDAGPTRFDEDPDAFAAAWLRGERIATDEVATDGTDDDTGSGSGAVLALIGGVVAIAAVGGLVVARRRSRAG